MGLTIRNMEIKISFRLLLCTFVTVLPLTKPQRLSAQSGVSYALSEKRTVFIQNIIDKHAATDNLENPEVIQTIMSEIGKTVPLAPAEPPEKTDPYTLKKMAAAENRGNVMKTIQTEAEKRYPLYKIGDWITINYYVNGRHYSVKGTLLRINQRSITVDDKKINTIDLDLDERAKYDPEANKAARSRYIERQYRFETTMAQQQEQIATGKIKTAIFKRNETAGYIYNPRSEQWETAQDVAKQYIALLLSPKSKKEIFPSEKAVSASNREQDQPEHLSGNTISNMGNIESVKNENGEICTEGIGVGTTRQDALHDAMKNAIEKAVGMYITTKSVLKDQELNELIIINSDATVTNYKETDCVEHNGVWVIKIEARILPNELLKYCPKLLTEEVSSTEIGNLINKRDALKNADKTLDDIFEDYYLKLVKFRKRGTIEGGSEIDLNSDKIPIKINFAASIDQVEYDKFQKRICALLDIFALGKTTYTVTLKKQTDSNLEIPESVGKKLWTKAGIKKNDEDKYSFVIFENHKGNVVYFTIYLIQQNIVNILENKCDEYAGDKNTYLVVSFLNRDKDLSARQFIYIDLYNHPMRFDSYRDDFDFYRHKILTFCNRLYLDIGKGIQLDPSANGSITLSVPVDTVKDTQSILLYLLISQSESYEDKRDKECDVIESKYFTPSPK